jgi:hypothetical protein
VTDCGGADAPLNLTHQQTNNECDHRHIDGGRKLGDHGKIWDYRNACKENTILNGKES